MILMREVDSSLGGSASSDKVSALKTSTIHCQTGKKLVLITS
jgi:hypothetical protein